MMRPFLPLALLACLAAGTVAARAGTVSGTIRDAGSLAPIEGATVMLHAIDPDSVMLPATSDGAGAYSIAGVPAGNSLYILICSHPGYAGFYAHIQDPNPGPLTFDVLLDPEAPPPPPPGGDPDSSEVGGSVFGLSSSGETVPLAGATVRLQAGSDEEVALTGADGRYSLRLLAGTYAITVYAGGYETLSEPGIEAPPSGLTFNAVLRVSTTGVPGLVRPEPRVGWIGAHPNPFEGTTTCRFVLARAGHVEIRAYDLAGREARRIDAGWMPAGRHELPFAAAGLPRGVYFVTVRSAGAIAGGTITLLR